MKDWRPTQIADDRQVDSFSGLFLNGELEAPRSLLLRVHRLYFEPQYPSPFTREVCTLRTIGYFGAEKCSSSFREGTWRSIVSLPVQLRNVIVFAAAAWI
jgi:hypothetical protein